MQEAGGSNPSAFAAYCRLLIAFFSRDAMTGNDHATELTGKENE